ncbi:MAG: AAA family ATPase [Cytophagales bacterium]|nr:AAA family ATPase [Cytophagales bacterium]
MATTQLKKLSIKKFRALSNVEVEFGESITVICGKNGTSKSSILGLAAQIFSFEKDYFKDQDLTYRTITEGQFKSLPKEHFRMSSKFDTPGSMDVKVELFDGYSDTDATAELGLSKRGKGARPVVRKNSTALAGENESRNFTHPVIHLSLKRLYPITERSYSTRLFAYLEKHKSDFIGLTNELLNRVSSSATGTAGTISSAVAYGDNYDQDSVSAGEDNAGQIMLALMSFRKLQAEYADYKGGLLLIDEADAGLFPAAQLKLIDIFKRECPKLKLQVVMTSHSPTLIEYVHKQSQQFRRRFKTIYLSDTDGRLEVKHDVSWFQIDNDIHTKSIKPALSLSIDLPTINVYFEDNEASDLFKVLFNRHPAKKYLKLLEVSLGCKSYIDLAKRKIDEFSLTSIICLDGDVDSKDIKNLPSIVTLPGALPPDQLIFEYLYNLPASDAIWKNSISFNRPVFTKTASELMSRLAIQGNTVNLIKVIKAEEKRLQSLDEKDKPKKSLRDLFKQFYKNEELQNFLKIKNNEQNPWRCWARDNSNICDDFVNRFIRQLMVVMEKGHHVDKAKLLVLQRKPISAKLKKQRVTA